MSPSQSLQKQATSVDEVKYLALVIRIKTELQFHLQVNGIAFAESKILAESILNQFSQTKVMVLQDRCTVFSQPHRLHNRSISEVPKT